MNTSKKEKVLFFCSTPYDHVGSYRIWVRDLSYYLKQNGVTCQVSNTTDKIKDYDIIVCGKEDASMACAIKRKFPDKSVGVINLAADKKNLDIDFVIVGSIEEMDSLSHYENVFLFPLIENMYQNCSLKQHTQKDVLRIGFHGHFPHLSKFEPALKKALEHIDGVLNMELLVVTTDKNFDWQHGRPNIKKIIMKSWNLESVKDDIMTCDIGIVPNVTRINMHDPNHRFQLNNNFGLHTTDYVVRMKNKSNAGRAFVFHQLGIPVVADLTPSNFHILGDPRCGSVAFNKKSWIKGIMSLTDPKTRQQIAANAKKEFDRLYDPIEWAERLYDNMRGKK
tara:strand:- start:1061 stop:2068 length:1008 start_codon:yes stop_codon:yes gene_type:complete